MPIYEYDCLECGKIEIFQDINDEKLTKCPTCKNKIKRLISSKVVAETVYRNARENYHKVLKPEAKEIADKIRNGDEDAAADIFGENKKIG